MKFDGNKTYLSLGGLAAYLAACVLSSFMAEPPIVFSPAVATAFLTAGGLSIRHAIAKTGSGPRLR